MSLTGPDAASLWLHLGAGLALYGLGLAMTVAPLTATVLDAVPPDRSGVASATNNATARVAGLVAVGALGTVAGDVFDLAAFQRAALTTAAFFALGAITAFVGVRAAPRRPDASGPEPATIPTEEENSGRSV
jgi:MFS family permease